jgi:glucose/mannose-6-phosphate isomerase
MSRLGRDEVARVDASNQLADVLALPAHLEDALWRVESSGVEPVLDKVQDFESLIVCGMGGSAIGADLAGDMLGDRLTRPLHTIRSYALPSWATPSSLVVCASYSGDTDETLACFEAAGVLGASRVVVTAGGQLADSARAEDVPVIPLPGILQPRAAVAYMLVSVLELAAHSGVASGMRTELDAAAPHLSALGEQWGPDSDTDNLAKQLAELLHETVPCVYGARPTTAIARRWKTQINENSKLPAYFAELPEADHNEIVGWEGARAVGIFTAVLLQDADQHPRVRNRIELTAGAIEATGAQAVRVWSRGGNRVERLLSLVLLGDVVSIYIAVLRGVDPTPVEAIDRLKARLAREGVG